MENASKALLIAGGVLIAMVIASFGVYLYGVFHSHSENLLAAMSEKEVNEFNAKFQAFDGRSLNANEVISVLNLVWNNNVENADKIEASFLNATGGHSLDLQEEDNTSKLSAANYPQNYKINDIQKKWNKFIYNYSEIAMIKLKDNSGNYIRDDSGNIKTESGYKYLFPCKITEYSNKGTVSKIEFRSIINET